MICMRLKKSQITRQAIVRLIFYAIFIISSSVETIELKCERNFQFITTQKDHGLTFMVILKSF